MRVLFVFVFLLGLVSCDNRKSAPKCEEIEGEIGDQRFLELNKNYTGIIKKCREFGKIYRYSEYKNGKLDGEERIYSHVSSPFESFNVFDFFISGRLIGVNNYENGVMKSSKSYLHLNGNLYSEANYTSNIESFYYDDGKLATKWVFKDMNSSRDVIIEEYFDKKGNKVKTNQLTSSFQITHTLRREIYDFVGIAITPFTVGILLIIFFIRRRKKKKLKKSS